MKFLLSDFWHVLLFPKDFKMRGSSIQVKKKYSEAANSTFFDEYFLNEELLHFYSEIKSRYNLRSGIYSSGTLFKAPELKSFLDPVFDVGFSSSEILFEKSNPDGFTYLSNKLEVIPSEIIFIDDSLVNIEAATEAGVHAIQYKSNSEVVSEVTAFFNGRV